MVTERLRIPGAYEYCWNDCAFNVQGTGAGGAVWGNVGGAMTSFKFSGCSFTCTATGMGGALYFGGATLGEVGVVRCCFLNCQTTAGEYLDCQGGAICFEHGLPGRVAGWRV
jgi:hypothetical protein